MQQLRGGSRRPLDIQESLTPSVRSPRDQANKLVVGILKNPITRRQSSSMAEEKEPLFVGKNRRKDSNRHQNQFQQPKCTSSQLIYDETTGKHYLLREIKKPAQDATKQTSHDEGDAVCETSVVGVSHNGQIPLQHNSKVTGKMNFAQRQRYAASSTHEEVLKVDSPRSLRGKSTEKMYLPRTDKFEGYAQFPRPKLPPEGAQSAVKMDKYGSLIAKGNSVRGPNSIAHNAADAAQAEAISIRELLEIQLKRKQEKERIQKKAEDFMKTNLGFLTGTQVGAGSNRATYTQIARKQVGDLADPKGVPKKKKMFRGVANLASADQASRASSQSHLTTKRPSLTKEGQQVDISPLQLRRGCAALSTSIAESARGPALKDFNQFIVQQLKKDPALPSVSSLDKQAVLSLFRKSKRLTRDEQAIKNLKAVLSVRDRLSEHSAGKLVNGRQLGKPVATIKVEQRQQASSVGGPGGESQRKGAYNGSEMSQARSRGQTFDQSFMTKSYDQFDTISQQASFFQKGSGAGGIGLSRAGAGSVLNQSFNVLPGSTRAQRSLFNFRNRNNASQAQLAKNESSSALQLVSGPFQGLNEHGSQMSQISLIEKSPSQFQRNQSSTIFSINPTSKTPVEQSMMQKSRLGAPRYDNSLTLEQVIDAKKRRKLVPGYNQIKPEHPVGSFLNRTAIKMHIATPSSDTSQKPLNQDRSQSQITNDKPSRSPSQAILKDSLAEQNTISNPVPRINLPKAQEYIQGVSSRPTISLNMTLNTDSANSDSSSVISDVDVEGNLQSGRSTRQRYKLMQTTCSPFTRHSPANSMVGFGSQAVYNPSSARQSGSPTQPVVKSLNQLRQAMFVPHDESKATQQKASEWRKVKTKGRFGESAADSAVARSIVDKEWLAKANPDFVRLQKQKSNRQEQLIRKRQLNRTLKEVREEYKAGIKVSREPSQLGQ